MKIRLEATEKEIKEFLVSNIKLDGKIFKTVSKFYANRENEFVNLTKKTGRVYVEIG